MAQYATGTQVKDTFHNLRRTATKSPMDTMIKDYGEICVYCHTPHNTNTAIEAPLWNRSAPSGPYTMYSSPTLDMTIAGSPQGVSLACLSCHDGSLALDAILRAPKAYTGTVGGGSKISTCASGCHAGSSPAGGYNFTGVNLGTDLSNDHPVSLTYDTTKDPDFNALVSGKVGTLPLYGTGKNQVECGSCHNPHDNSKRPFLRVANADSALCLTCHKK